MHINKINTKKYIGITSAKPPSNRWANGEGYNRPHKSHLYSAIQKYGWDNFQHVILYHNLSKDEACQKEVELIKVFNTTDRQYGYNKSTGGETNFITENGRKTISEKAKERLSVPENNPFYKKHHTDEAKSKMSMAHKKLVGDKHPQYGKHHSEETKNKIRYNKNISKETVLCDENGKEIKRYKNAKEASLETGIEHSAICRCCRGESKYTLSKNRKEKYYWKYIKSDG